MKKVRLILGMGALAVGAFAIYYLMKEKKTAVVEPVGSKKGPSVEEPSVSEEDQAIMEETFRDSEAAEVTDADTQETQETEATSEIESEPAVASDEETKETVSAFKPAPGNRRIGQYDDEMNLIAEYDSATVAAKAVGSNRTSIRNCANGKQKHAGGFVWRYLDQQTDLTE